MRDGVEFPLENIRVMTRFSWDYCVFDLSFIRLIVLYSMKLDCVIGPVILL